MAEEPPVVRPSSPLIRILHRKLRDPGIVPAFERHRARSLIEGLVRPHWVLSQQQPLLRGAEEHAVGVGAGTDAGAAVEDNGVTGDGNSAAGNAKDDDSTRNNDASVSDDVDRSGKCIPDGNGADVNGDAPKTNPATNCEIPKHNSPSEACENNNVTKSEIITTNSNQKKNITEYNTIPARNYIDLRMEQNRMFADSQCLQCQVILSKLFQSYSPPIESTSAAMASSNKDKQWKKQADTIQSLINEGLAACPTHQGLLGAEREYKSWIQRKIDSLTSNRMVEGGIAVAGTAGTGGQGGDVGNGASVASGRPITGTNMHTRKKGAEGRAHAAMRDALLERSFFLGDGDKDHDGKGGMDKSYPLLLPSDKGEKVGGEGDDGRGQELNKKEQWENRHGENSDSIGDSRYSRSRDRHRERRRERKRTSRKHKRDSSRREKKRRRKSRYHDDDHARRKEERGSSASEQRSRSRSRSISSSMSRSSSSSASSYWRRNHRRRSKERKRKKHRRRHHRRSRSSTKHQPKNEKESEVNNDVDYAGDEKKDNEDVLLDKMQATKSKC